MKINNTKVIPMESEYKGTTTEAVYDYKGQLISLMYDGKLYFDLVHNINKISSNLINFQEASYKLNKGKKEFSNDKLYYINIAREIGLDKTIKAMQEELSLRGKLHKASYEVVCLKALKKMARKCK